MGDVVNKQETKPHFRVFVESSTINSSFPCLRASVCLSRQQNLPLILTTVFNEPTLLQLPEIRFGWLLLQVAFVVQK